MSTRSPSPVSDTLCSGPADLQPDPPTFDHPSRSSGILACTIHSESESDTENGPTLQHKRPSTPKRSEVETRKPLTCDTNLPYQPHDSIDLTDLEAASEYERSRLPSLSLTATTLPDTDTLSECPNGAPAVTSSWMSPVSTGFSFLGSLLAVAFAPSHSIQKKIVQLQAEVTSIATKVSLLVKSSASAVTAELSRSLTAEIRHLTRLIEELQGLIHDLPFAPHVFSLTSSLKRRATQLLVRFISSVLGEIYDFLATHSVSKGKPGKPRKRGVLIDFSDLIDAVEALRQLLRLGDAFHERETRTEPRSRLCMSPPPHLDFSLSPLSSLTPSPRSLHSLSPSSASGFRHSYSAASPLPFHSPSSTGGRIARPFSTGCLTLPNTHPSNA